LVPELGPSFEKAVKDKAQEVEERKVEKEDKRNLQLLLVDVKEPST
jgi:hypothetical protein